MTDLPEHEGKKAVSRMIFVNLPATDVERSAAFYEALGFRKDLRFSQPGIAAAMVWSDAISFMLLSHQRFADFTGKRIIDAQAEVQTLLALSMSARAEVDAIVDKAAAHGGRPDPGPKQDYGFMYGRSFEDPDGHVFEPIWMDLTAAMAAMDTGQAPG